MGKKNNLGGGEVGPFGWCRLRGDKEVRRAPTVDTVARRAAIDYAGANSAHVL